MHYDLIVIGLGIAGGHILQSIMADKLYTEKKVLVIDDAFPGLTLKTICFWEQGKGLWDHLLQRKFEHSKFYARSGEELNLDLKGYQYKMLHSADFLQDLVSKIQQVSNIDFLQDRVMKHIENEDEIVVHTARSETYSASRVLDSRFTSEFRTMWNEGRFILQHFKGWVIESPNDVFEDSTFTVMDFREAPLGSTCFFYVLPYSSCKALVECTFFTLGKKGFEQYDVLLRRFISRQITQKEFHISDQESGVIPMSSYSFESANTRRLTKIGTAGGWVRASTGYSFRRSAEYAKKIVDAIQSDSWKMSSFCSKKERFYDGLLLKILAKRNHLGPEIFHRIYSKNPMDRIFRFLDGNSSWLDDAQVIKSCPKIPFLKALLGI